MIRKDKQWNKTTLSDYFNSSRRQSEEGNGFNSMVNPNLSQFNIDVKGLKNSYRDIPMTDQEDKKSYILDIDMMYGKEIESKIPSIGRQERECIKQIIIDVMDISMNEYSMHYVLHSENEFMTPFKDLKKRIKKEFFKFYKTSCESIPFKLWNEIITEHCTVLSTFLPSWIMKDLHKHKFYFVKKYIKNRIKFHLKNYTKLSKKLKKEGEKGSMILMSANTDGQDRTVVSKEKYLETSVAEYLNTPFYDYFVSWFTIRLTVEDQFPLLVHIKENEVDIMNVYNQSFRTNAKFEGESKSKNDRIEKYKDPRGFPLKLSSNEVALYSFDEEITVHLLNKFTTEKEKVLEKKELQRMRADGGFNLSYSVDPDSCEDEIPFDFETERVRYSNTEKRTSNFNPFSSFNWVQSNKESDVDMEEEAKDEVNEIENINRPSLGNISALFKSHVGEPTSENDELNNKNEGFDSVSAFEDVPSLQGQRLERTSNISWKSILPTNSMLRFSDFENMDEDVEMDGMPERLSFKRN